jgi:hypothetical protein
MAKYGEYMTNEFGICPECGQANSYYEITRYDADEWLLTNHHLDGHICHLTYRIETYVKLVINEKKQECEIEKRYRKNDKDRPGIEAVEFIFKNHRTNPSSIFHVAKYSKSNNLKHIDCKTCNNEWGHDYGEPLENYFSFEHNPEDNYLHSFKIQCLKCNAQYNCINSM